MPSNSKANQEDSTSKKEKVMK